MLWKKPQQTSMLKKINKRYSFRATVYKDLKIICDFQKSCH